jgi:cytoskeletal protein CcmA (bactofilin family)
MSVLARSSNDSDYVAADQGKDSQSVKSGSPEQHHQTSPGSNAGPSLISAALIVIGQLESAGDIQIDGKVEGDIHGRMVRIGSGAVIKGTVFGEGVELAGTIEGKIEARAVVLTTTARMSGDIFHQSLQIDKGAFFDGISRPHHKHKRA